MFYLLVLNGIYYILPLFIKLNNLFLDFSILSDLTGHNSAIKRKISYFIHTCLQ